MQRTIQSVLQLRSPQVYRASPYRANLALRVNRVCSPGHRRHQVLTFIREQQGTAGLIYTRSRRHSESFAQWLEQQGHPAVAYHAGLPASQRRQVEANWLAGSLKIIVCTSAFGMGLNKPNVRWICHVHPPLTVAEYVQEIGRAGRDGLNAQALLLASEPTGWLDPQDHQQRRHFMQQRHKQYRQAQGLVTQLPRQGNITALYQRIPEAERVLSLLHSSGELQWTDPFHYVLRAGHRLKFPRPNSSQILTFIKTRSCRWQWILAHFGFTSHSQCGHCDRCSK